MHALLQDLNSLPGVVGSMFCDAHQGVLARAFPPDYAEADLREIASTVSGSAQDLRNVTGPIGVLDLRYRDSRVVIRPVGDAQLLQIGQGDDPVAVDPSVERDDLDHVG